MKFIMYYISGMLKFIMEGKHAQTRADLLRGSQTSRFAETNIKRLHRYISPDFKPRCRPVGKEKEKSVCVML